MRFPKQRLSYQDKIKDNFKWCKDTIDSLLIDHSLDTVAANATPSDYMRKLSNYMLYNNKLYQKDFEKICNPLGIDVGQFKDEVMPYNKTYNKINLLLQEEAVRPFNYRVALVNSEGIKSKLEEKNKMMKEYIYSVVQQAIS